MFFLGRIGQVPQHLEKETHTMLDTVKDLLANTKIPAIDAVQMSDLLQYLFSTAEKTLRIQVAEVVYRNDHVHPNALDVFLACTLPMAERTARSRAHRLFNCPSDWQVELMYDGAVKAMIAMFQCNYAVRPGTDAFRRYIVRALALGTVRSYFMRDENDSVRAVANLATVSSRKRPIRNKFEQDVITRELLRQVINFPQLRAPLIETLQCIAALGPDGALKEQAYPNLKRDRGRRPILDPDAIAEAMGTSRGAVHRNLREARIILREVFNGDGKLFLTR
jgi:hypothetical protein